MNSAWTLIIGAVVGALIGWLAAVAGGANNVDYVCACIPGTGGEADKVIAQSVNGQAGTCPHPIAELNLDFGCRQ